MPHVLDWKRQFVMIHHSPRSGSENSPFSLVLYPDLSSSPPSNSIRLIMNNAVNFFSETKLASAKTVFSTVASLLATAMVFRSVLQDFLPHEAQRIFCSGIRRFLKRFSPQMTMVIDEFDGLSYNQIFEAAETYLGSKVYSSSERLRVSRPPKERKFNINVERNQEVVDVFRGVKFRWLLLCTKTESRSMYNPRDLNCTIRSEVRSFELSFHKKHLDMVLDSYFPYILKESVSLRQEKKTLKLFTVDFEKMFGKMTDAWSSISLDHPATFDTIAMESELKSTILEDLERFVRRRDYYKKVGKAWKRGYLLYGPPGTGKSSLIAAIANYLNFDIYDLELTELRCNSELRRLLLSTANRSILVVEDIDCTIQLQDRLASQATNPRSFHFERQVTLSGLLNFMDGLWSSCGDERIIIFTTNHKNKLDPALLRPGRMDMHIHMSYCSPYGFKILAANYLGITNHYLFRDIENLIRAIEVTPAEVAEHLLKSDEPETALRDLIKFLEVKKEEDRVKKEREEQEKEEEEEEEDEEEEAKPKKELELQQGASVGKNDKVMMPEVMTMTKRMPQIRLGFTLADG